MALMTASIQTANVREIIARFASDSITPLRQCDFILHGVITYIKNCHIDTFVKYDSTKKELYKDPDQLINDRVVFRQIYKVTPVKRSDDGLKLDYHIEFDTFRTHPVLLLETSSIIPLKHYKPQELFSLLVKEINKIKALHGMLIGIFSDPMIADIKKLVKDLYTGTTTGTATILLFSGIEPEIARPGRLIWHFKEKNRASQIKEVEVGELIVEYIKPVFGRGGLNAMGRRISRGEADNEEFLSAQIDSDTIDKYEDEEQIRLFSKKRGFVHYDKNMIRIDNKLTLQKLKRIESQVAKEENNDVEIFITQQDITQDTIGEGVHLTSETIHISGYVADKSLLEARSLIIDGVSHNGSRLFAHEVTVNRHKGLLRCHKATIKLLEGGEVHASTVHVETALGGKIYADEITIGNVRHHLKAYATTSISINKISGEDNLLMIDYQQNPIIQSRIKFIEQDIDELRYQLDKAKRHNESDIPLIMEKINTLKDKLKAIKASPFSATIHINERINGFNTVVFSLPKHKEIRYRTVENQKYTPFYITVSEDEVTLHPVGLTLSLNK